MNSHARGWEQTYFEGLYAMANLFISKISRNLSLIAGNSMCSDPWARPWKHILGSRVCVF